MITALIEAFAPSFYNGYIIKWIAIPSDFLSFIFKPWTIFTHMFVHAGIWHVVWNLLIFYWVGKIVGDLIGDRHIWPIYLLAGLAGGFSILIAYQIIPQHIGPYGVGASAAIMGIVIVAGIINPDHEIRLPFIGSLIGNIKIKYIILAIIFFDLIGIGHKSNTGGHIGHISGMIMGWVYMVQLRNRNDLAEFVNGYTDRFLGIFDRSRRPQKKSPLSVKHKSDKIKTMAERRVDYDKNIQSQVDEILDKITQTGYESLTEIEKEILFKASKKK